MRYKEEVDKVEQELWLRYIESFGTVSFAKQRNNLTEYYYEKLLKKTLGYYKYKFYKLTEDEIASSFGLVLVEILNGRKFDYKKEVLFETYFNKVLFRFLIKESKNKFCWVDIDLISEGYLGSEFEDISHKIDDDFFKTLNDTEKSIITLLDEQNKVGEICTKLNISKSTYEDIFFTIVSKRAKYEES